MEEKDFNMDKVNNIILKALLELLKQIVKITQSKLKDNYES